MASDRLFANLAFISYSRRSEAELASRLQRDLERYAIPGAIECDRSLLARQKYLRPVFRDHTDLNVHTESFWNEIERELARTRFLIVLCSPAAAASEYVDREVASFVESHEGNLDLVLPIIAAGDITATNGPEACLPPALAPHREIFLARNLPLAGDCTPKELMLKTASWMLRVEYDALYRQHRYRQGRQRLLIGGISAAVLCVIGALAWKSWSDSQLAEQRRIENRQIDEERQKQASRAAAEEARATTKAYLANIRLAARAMDQGNLEAALAALEACDPKLRDWEWGFLRGELDQSVATIRVGAAAYPAALSADGKHLAVIADDNSVRVIALETQQEIARFKPGVEHVSSVAISADGERIALGTAHRDGGELLLWQRGAEKPSWRVDAGQIDKMLFTDDDQRIVAASPDGAVLQWKVADGKFAVPPLVTEGGAAGRFACSQDGSKIGVLDTDGRRLMAFDGGNGESLWKDSIAAHDSRADFTDVAISPDGQRVVVTTSGVGAWLADGATGKRSAKLDEVMADATRARFGRGGHILAVGQRDGRMLAYSYFPLVGKAQFLKEGAPHRAPISALALADFERVLLSGGEDGSLQSTILVSDGGAQFRGHFDAILGIEAVPQSWFSSPGAVHFVTWSRDRTVKLWSLSRPMTPIGRKFADPIRALQAGALPTTYTLSPDDRRAVRRSLQSPNGATLVDAATLQPIAELPHGAWVSAVVFDGPRQRVLTSSLGGAVKLWSTEDGKLLQEFAGHEGPVQAIAINSDGSHIAAGGKDPSVRVWDGRGKALPKWRQPSGAVEVLRFDASGQRLASADDAGNVYLWDVAAAKLVRQIEAHPGSPVQALQFSADGQRLLSAASDGTCKLWDAASGAALQAFVTPQPLVDAALAPGEKRLATLSSDALLGLWHVEQADQALELPLAMSQGVSLQFASDGHTLLIMSGGGGIVRLRGRTSQP